MKLASVWIVLTCLPSVALSQPASVNPGEGLGNFRFNVEINGIAQLPGFFAVDGLNWQTEVIPYVAGNDQDVKKLPGRTKYSTITLKRAFDGRTELWDWYKTVIDGNFQRRAGSIIFLNAAGQEVVRYNFFEAWPSRYRIQDMNSRERGVLTEEIEVVVEKVERG